LIGEVENDALFLMHPAYHLSKIAMTLKFSRKNFESAGLLPTTKVVFDLEEINADENWIFIKISKAAAE